MAASTRAMDSACVFKILLNGGHICEKIRPCRNKRNYNVLAKDESYPAGCRQIGHITELQFVSFLEEGIIQLLDEAPNNKDKYGNVYYFYVLARPEEGV